MFAPPASTILAADIVARQFAEIAPGAPAVPEVERDPLTPRLRSAVAGGLVRVAAFVAPRERSARGRITLRWDA